MTYVLVSFTRQDIELCSLAAKNYGAKLSPAWQRAFFVMNALRRWLFLPFLMMTVPVLLMYLGGDALHVCFK